MQSSILILAAVLLSSQWVQAQTPEELLGSGSGSGSGMIAPTTKTSEAPPTTTPEAEPNPAIRTEGGRVHISTSENRGVLIDGKLVVNDNETQVDVVGHFYELNEQIDFLTAELARTKQALDMVVSNFNDQIAQLASRLDSADDFTRALTNKGSQCLDDDEYVIAIESDGTPQCGKILPTKWQQRVHDPCPVGQYVSAILEDGTVRCAVDIDTDTIVSIDHLQPKVTGTCDPSQDKFIASVNNDGSVTCGTISDSRWQRRVSGSCPTSSNNHNFMYGVNQNGSPLCRVPSAAYWQRRVASTSCSNSAIKAISSTGGVSCLSTESTKPPSVNFIEWGPRTCTTGTRTYEGWMGGAHYTHRGSGANYLCMARGAQYDRRHGGNQDGGLIYRTEYETGNNVIGFGGLQNRDAACASCTITGASESMMIPGRVNCYSGWTEAYQGYIMSNHYTQQKSEFICVSKRADKATGGSDGNQNGALLYSVETEGPVGGTGYSHNHEVACVVCYR